MAALAASLGGGPASALAGDAEPGTRLAAAGVRAIGDDVAGARISVGRVLAPFELPGPGWLVEPRWALGAGAWRPRGDAQGDTEGSVSARLTGSLPLSPGGRWRLELGTGVLYLSDRRLTDDLDLGTRFHFDSHIGLALRFGGRQAWELAYQLHHISNASLSSTNPGMDFHQVELGYRY